MSKDQPTIEDSGPILRPIPDGGLASGIPDWLNKRPSWSRSAPPVTVLEPDSSTIDPRFLVSDEDLPDWLRELASRDQVSVTPDGTILDPEFDVDPDASVTDRASRPLWKSELADTVNVQSGPESIAREWFESGEPVAGRSYLLQDPVLLVLGAAAVIIIIIAVILLAM